MKRKEDKFQPGYTFQNPKWHLQDDFLSYYKVLTTRILKCEITMNDLDENMKIPDRYLDEKKKETKVYKFIEHQIDT